MYSSGLIRKNLLFLRKVKGYFHEKLGEKIRISGAADYRLISNGVII